jgi:hypothetical protein
MAEVGEDNGVPVFELLVKELAVDKFEGTPFHPYEPK